jgi:hypothetical protein
VSQCQKTWRTLVNEMPKNMAVCNSLQGNIISRILPILDILDILDTKGWPSLATNLNRLECEEISAMPRVLQSL